MDEGRVCWARFFVGEMTGWERAKEKRRGEWPRPTRPTPRSHTHTHRLILLTANPHTPITMNKPLDENGLPAGYPFQPDWEVTPRAVKALMDAGQVGQGEGQTLLLDVRTPAEVATAAIDGAMVVALQEIRSHLPDLEAFAEGPVVVSCHHGGRSMQVVAFLREQGFDDVKSMAGGIDLWAQEVDPSVTRY